MTLQTSVTNYEQIMYDTSVNASQAVELPAAREPTGTAPVQSVDVVHLPFEELTPLESPETDAKVPESSVCSLTSSALDFDQADLS